MKPEEAIKMITDDLRLHHDYLSGNYRKALGMAISALGKQIPKKPTDEGWLYCPICGKYILPEGYKFCSCCGQAIDLGDNYNE